MPVGVAHLLLLAAAVVGAPTLLTASPINRQVGISQDVFITLQNDTYGHEHRVCSIDSLTYGDGETIPTSSPCEHCICRPPGFACTIISCEYRAGCKAIKRSNQCCPEYQCECEKDGKIYANGEKIVDGTNPCEICYCQGGEILCAVIDCYWRSDCQPRYVQDRCCPLYDHCPPPHQSQGPFAQRINTTPSTTTSTTSTGGPFPWANFSSAVFNEFDQDRPMVVVATSRPEVAVLGSQVEEEKKEIFSAPEYLPQASSTETSSTEAPPGGLPGDQQHHNEQVSEATLQPVSSEQHVSSVSPSQESLPLLEEELPEVTTQSVQSDLPEEVTTSRVIVSVNEDPSVSHDQVDTTNVPTTEVPSLLPGVAQDESSGTQRPSSSIENEVAESTEGSSGVGHDETDVSPTEVPEKEVHDEEVILTTEEPANNKVLQDLVQATEAPVPVVGEVETTEEPFTVFQQDEPAITTERIVEIVSDEIIGTTEGSSSASHDEVVPATEDSLSSVNEEEEIPHSDPVTTEVPFNAIDDDVIGTTEIPSNVLQDEVTVTTEVPMDVSHDEVATTEPPSSVSMDEVVPTEEVPVNVAQEEPAATQIPPSGDLQDDTEVSATTSVPSGPAEPHNDSEAVDAENMVNISSEDIIPPDEGVVADLPEIHNQVFVADGDTVELSAPHKDTAAPPTAAPAEVADQPETVATPVVEEDDEEEIHPDDQHGDAENGYGEMNTTSPPEEVPEPNRFRLDLSSNEISIEEGKKPEDILHDATTLRPSLRDELSSDDDVRTTGIPTLNDEPIGTTESVGNVYHDEVSTLPPDSRLKSDVAENDEAIEASTVSIISHDESGTTEAYRLRTGVLSEEGQSDIELTTEFTSRQAEETANDDTVTTLAPSKLRSELFDSVENVEKTTVISAILHSGVQSSDEEEVNFDAAGETTIVPSRLRSGLVSSEEGEDAVTTISPSRLQTPLSEEEKLTPARVVETTEAPVANDEASDSSTVSSRLRFGLLDDETSTGSLEVSTLLPSRLRSSLSQELFSSEDDSIPTTGRSVNSAVLNDESPTTSVPFLPKEPENRLRTSGEEPEDPSTVVYQDFVEVTSTAPIQEEIISYTSQPQHLRSDDPQEHTTESPLHDSPSTPPDSQSDDILIDSSTISPVLRDDPQDLPEEQTTPQSIPEARRVVDMLSHIPPFDPAMSKLNDDMNVVGGDEEIHSDDGLSPSSSDSWFTATYNKLRALAGLFPKEDASSKPKQRQRSPRRHL